MQSIKPDEFLNSLGLQEYLPKFQEQRIDEKSLPTLTKSDLEKMGIEIGPRNIIMAELNRLSAPLVSLGDEMERAPHDGEEHSPEQVEGSTPAAEPSDQSVHQPTAAAAQPVPVPPPPPPKIPVPVKRLPINLTAGQDCRVALAAVIPELGDWVVELEESELLGVSLDAGSGELFFCPTQAGEHFLKLELKHPENTTHPALPKSIAVTVNPDPDSLWQNKPSDPSVPYYKADTDCKEVVTPFARILAASQRGRSHAHEGSCRDDDFRVRYDEKTGWHLLTAADGAGSAKYSRQGSLIACETALAHMGDWLAKEEKSLQSAVENFLSSAEHDKKHLQSPAYGWLGSAAFEALKAIKAEAEQHDPPATVRDFHTTLLLAAAKSTPSGWLMLTFSVGDGGIAAVSADGEPVGLCTPDSGDFSGQTVFLTGPGVLRSGEDVLNRLHVQLVPELLALYLMTDGITDPKFPTEASFTDKETWASFLTELSEKVNLGSAGDGAESRLLSWLGFRSPGNHDDRTIVVLINTPPEPEPAAQDKDAARPGFLSRLFGGGNKPHTSPAEPPSN